MDQLAILLFVAVVGAFLLVEAEKQISGWLYRRRKKQHEERQLAEAFRKLESANSQLQVQIKQLNELSEWQSNRLSLHHKAILKLKGKK